MSPAPRKPKPAARSWYNLPGHLYALSQDKAGRNQLLIYVAIVILTLAVGGLIDATIWSAPEPVTPDEFKMGWDEATAKAEAPRIAAMMPKFAIMDGEGNQVSGAGKSSELWKFAKLSNGGKHIATWRQESGDCVSMGWSNAVAYRMGFQIAKEQRNEVLKIPFPPFMYGVSRWQIGKGQLGRGAGSIGAWAAQGSQAYGTYTTEQAANDGFKYSGQLADQWGRTGPPKATLDFAKKFRIRTISQVRTWDDCRDALVHGYPVTVASNVGFQGGFYDADGKRWLKRGGSWGHQMCFIGCEDRPGRRKGCYCINSWGTDAHPKPLNDEPPGGFWVDSQTVAAMVGQGDSYAYSDFDGFPAADLTAADWDLFRDEVIQSGDGDEQAAVVAAETPEPEPVLKETRKMWAFPISLVLLVCGAGLMAYSLWSKYGDGKRLRTGGRTAGALLLALSLIGLGGSASVNAGQRRQARLQARQAACQQYQTSIAATAVSADDSRGQMICNGRSCRLVKPSASAPAPVAKPVAKPSPPATVAPAVNIKTTAAIEHEDAWQVFRDEPVQSAVAATSPMPTNWNAFEDVEPRHQFPVFAKRPGEDSEPNPFLEEKSPDFWNVIQAE